MHDADIARYASHSRWSHPGPYGSLLDALPAAPAALPEIVCGLVLHPSSQRDCARSLVIIMAATLPKSYGSFRAAMAKGQKNDAADPRSVLRLR